MTESAEQNWNLDGREYPRQFMERINPEEVLYEFDWPITFTFRCKVGLFLAHLCTESNGSRRHIAVPVNLKTIDDLKSGRISLHSAFNHQFLWVVDCGNDFQVTGVWTVFGLLSLPQNCLPDDTATLYPKKRIDGPPEWIDVKFRRPEAMKKVILWIKPGVARLGYIYFEKELWLIEDCIDDDGKLLRTFIPFEDVTHWMELKSK